MPFRSAEASPPIYTPADPLARFSELHQALDAERTWLQDKVPLRMAAVSLLTTPGDAAELAHATRRVDAALAARISWLSQVSPSTRILIAAQLVKHGDDPDLYVDEVERVRALFRTVVLRRGYAYEYAAVLVLRRVLGEQPIELRHVERFRDIYGALKLHHWFLTGPEDFPACAMLVGCDADPGSIGAGTDAIYRALHERADLWRGEALHTAANVLFLGGASPTEVADRFALLVTHFRGAGAKIGQGQYDELAILCFLARPVEKIVEVVMQYHGQLRARIDWLFKHEALSLAAGLAFVQLAGRDGTLAQLADAKLLVDMQAIIAARAAAAA